MTTDNHQRSRLEPVHTARLNLYRFTKPILYCSEITIEKPKFALTILSLLTILLAAGFTWLSTDDALDNFLKSNSPDYQAFQYMERHFPSSGDDLFVTVEGKSLFTKKNLTTLQDLSIALQFSERVASVVSIFSLRKPLQSRGTPPPLIPGEIPADRHRLAALQDQILAHPLAKGRLLSPPGNASQLALFIVSLKGTEIRRIGLPNINHELHAIVAEVAKDSDLRFGLSGMPVMTSEIVESAGNDVIVFNVIGFLVGTFICFLFFRRLNLTMIAHAPALLAIIWCLGLFGWTGTKIDPLMNAIMPLVLVVTFNNAMHLLFAINRNLATNPSKPSAIREAVVEIGPACALTSITTSIALFSLVYSNSMLIRTFGTMAGLSVLISLNLVLVLLPLLAHFFLKSAPQTAQITATDKGESSNAGLRGLDQATAAISTFVARMPQALVAAGTLATIICAIAYFQLQPRYILSEMLPDHGKAADVMKRTEAKLGGLFPLSIMLEWPASNKIHTPKVLTAIAKAHAIIEAHPKISKVNSYHDLQLWAQSGGLPANEASARLLETLPPSLLARFINTEKRSALVSGYIGDLEAKEILTIQNELQPKLDELQRQYPTIKMSITGLASMSASRSVSIISQLSYSMLGAVIVVIAVIGLAFRSFWIAGVSTIPNLFALFATGTLLLLLHGGLEYATIVGLTVAFGLAVDDTIHVLNRYQIERQDNDNPISQIDRTLKLIGKVLILTTLVLLAGLSVTQLSAMPPTRQFGMICISTLIFALIADLIILPALIICRTRLKAHASTRTPT